ncbi:MAG TPA: GIY-YIG nuclease family protein [Thermomicrobiaceae bacterium]|nr:GIY-YIG nuclease family protein [Thermomicrobiaceae bacterium]
MTTSLKQGSSRQPVEDDRVARRDGQPRRDGAGGHGLAGKLRLASIGARPASEEETSVADRERRKALRRQYDQTQRAAGVHRLLNTGSGKALLGSSPNLASVRAKLEFARQTNSASALDYRLKQDAATFGIDALALETTPEMTRAAILADLETLEQLWREKLDPAALY